MFLLAVTLLGILTYAVYRLDHQALVDEAFFENQRALKQIEVLIEEQLNQARVMLSEATNMNTREKVMAFEADPESLNRSLNRQFLTGQDWNDYLEGRLLPLLSVLPYRWKDVFFQRISRRLCEVFDPAVPLALVASHPDAVDPIVAIRALDIKPEVDYQAQTITIHRSQFEKLDLLDGKRDNVFFHTAFQHHTNPGWFDFSQEEVERIVPIAGGDQSDLAGYERPAIWMVCYIYRAETRLGTAWHPFSELAIHAFRPNPVQSRGVFFRGSSASSRYAYIWNWSPASHPFDGDRVHLIPYRVNIGMMAEGNLALILLKQLLSQKGISGHHVTAEFDNDLVLAHNGEMPGSEPLKNPDDELQAVVADTKNQSWYMSSMKSYLLPGVRLTIGTPALRVQTLHRQRFVWTFLLFPLAFLGYAFGVRAGRQPVSTGFDRTMKSMLGLGKVEVGNEGCLELNRLQRAMKDFADVTRIKQRELKFHSDLRQILNQPNQSLQWYLEEFFYVAHGMSESLRFEVEYAQPHPEGRVNLKFQPVPAELEPLVQILREQAKEASRIVWLARRGAEETRLNTELSLGRTLQKKMLGEDKEIRGGGYLLRIQTRQSSHQPAGDIVGVRVIADTVRIYVSTVIGRGLGTSLVAAYLQHYLDALLGLDLGPEDLLHRVHLFLGRHRELKDAYLGLHVLELCPSGEIIQAGAGHYPAVGYLGGRDLVIRARHAPLGLFNGPFVPASQTMIPNDSLCVATGGLWDAVREQSGCNLAQAGQQIIAALRAGRAMDFPSQSGFVAVSITRET